MLKVSNSFYEESMGYRASGKPLYDRMEELEELQKVIQCCSVNREPVESSAESLYGQEIAADIALWEWLFQCKGEGSEDLRRFVLELVQTFSEPCADYDERIRISLGACEDCADTEAAYWAGRREILKKLGTCSEFYDFMKSCFVHSEFSPEARNALKEIKDFALHTEEIVFNLSLLNDEGLEIYKRHKENEELAIKELASRALDCSGDPRHKKQLKFPFTYEEEVEGKAVIRTAEICCTPHMKLIRRNSDLRIYFYWRDRRIGGGEKILIGRIGGHPY